MHATVLFLCTSFPFPFLHSSSPFLTRLFTPINFVSFSSLFPCFILFYFSFLPVPPSFHPLSLSFTILSPLLLHPPLLSLFLSSISLPIRPFSSFSPLRLSFPLFLPFFLSISSLSLSHYPFLLSYFNYHPIKDQETK